MKQPHPHVAAVALVAELVQSMLIFSHDFHPLPKERVDELAERVAARATARATATIVRRGAFAETAPRTAASTRAAACAKAGASPPRPRRHSAAAPPSAAPRPLTHLQWWGTCPPSRLYPAKLSSQLVQWRPVPLPPRPRLRGGPTAARWLCATC